MRHDMSPSEYRDILEKLGLSQSEAGVFFGGTPLTGRRWAAVGGSGPPPAVAMMLRLMVRLKFSVSYINDILD